jgi:hypothetical protein
MSVLVNVQPTMTARHRIAPKHVAANAVDKAYGRPVVKLWVPLMILLFVSAGVGAGYGFVMFAKLRNSVATQHAVNLALANKVVSQDLGQSVQVGYFVGGNIYDHMDGTGNADLTIEVKGSNGSGTLYASEYEINGNWYAEKLTFRPDQDLEMIQVPELPNAPKPQ